MQIVNISNLEYKVYNYIVSKSYLIKYPYTKQQHIYQSINEIRKNIFKNENDMYSYVGIYKAIRKLEDKNFINIDRSKGNISGYKAILKI